MDCSTGIFEVETVAGLISSGFTMSGKLWALNNCLALNHPTCDREKELTAKTFNKSK